MSSSPQDNNSPPLNILLTHPRTASHLLLQILNLPSQPSILRTPPPFEDGYFFQKPLFLHFTQNLPAKPLPSRTLAENEELRNALQEAYSNIEKYVQEAKKEGKGVFFKEHVHSMLEPISQSRFLFPQESINEEVPWRAKQNPDLHPSTTDSQDNASSLQNPTFLPDTFLLELKPTFLIRHPALVFPSLLRTALDLQGPEVALQECNSKIGEWEMSLHWQYTLYQWYKNNLPEDKRKTGVEGMEWPIILDADDVIEDREVLLKYCEIASLDKGMLRWEWEKQEGREGQGRMESRMKSTLLASTGIVKAKSGRGINLEVEKEKWKVEFGDDVAAKLWERVEGSLGMYVEMRGQRLKV